MSDNNINDAGGILRVKEAPGYEMPPTIAKGIFLFWKARVTSNKNMVYTSIYHILSVSRDVLSVFFNYGEEVFAGFVGDLDFLGTEAGEAQVAGMQHEPLYAADRPSRPIPLAALGGCVLA